MYACIILEEFKKIMNGFTATTSYTLNVRRRIRFYFLIFSPNDAISPIVFWTNCVTSCTAATRSFSDFFSSYKNILNVT